MRISDWSSDVCSSDLPTRGSQSSRRRASEMSGQRCIGSSAGSGRKTSFERAPVIAITVSASARIGISTGLPRFRSEEHTSELQSLMRISYAVFCLKNKNNTYLIDLHTTTNQSLIRL